MVCPTHGMRRYGWRSLPTMDTPAGRRPNFRFAGYTPLEVERIVFFGEEPPEKLVVLEFHRENDKRDNRDPEGIGSQLLAMGSRLVELSFA